MKIAKMIRKKSMNNIGSIRLCKLNKTDLLNQVGVIVKNIEDKVPLVKEKVKSLKIDADTSTERDEGDLQKALVLKYQQICKQSKLRVDCPIKTNTSKVLPLVKETNKSFPKPIKSKSTIHGRTVSNSVFLPQFQPIKNYLSFTKKNLLLAQKCHNVKVLAKSTSDKLFLNQLLIEDKKRDKFRKVTNPVLQKLKYRNPHSFLTSFKSNPITRMNY